MSKQKYYLAAGALVCSAFSGLALPLANTFAEGSSSMFDSIADDCVIRNYNDENHASVSSIEDVDFEKITTLTCNDMGITNFHGLVLMKNLEHLNVSKNPNLYLEDSTLEALPKLKSLDVHGNYQNYYNISKNPDLEEVIGYDLSLRTSAFVERANGDSYDYMMDLSGLKFINSDSIVSDDSSKDTYDDAEKVFSFKEEVPVTISVDNGIDMYGGRNTLRIYTRTGYMGIKVFLNGDEEVETHNPIHLNNKCEEMSDGYYMCDNTVYSGDIIDTDVIIKDTLSKIFNLSGYELSQVKIVPPTANVKLTTNTDTLKKGTILADANFTLEFHFDLADPVSTPETGAFTASTPQGASAVAIISALITGITSSIVAFPKIRKMVKRKD